MKSCPLPLLYTLVSAAQLIKRQWRKFLWLSWPHLVITQLGGWLLSNPFFSEQMPLVFLTGVVMIGVTAGYRQNAQSYFTRSFIRDEESTTRLWAKGIESHRLLVIAIFRIIGTYFSINFLSHDSI
ncbi:hypothetical protein ACT691_00990 [Vibrio metschnikovii]